jgi:OFA family oxalate/formate antiporter-like MFS transporter
MVNDRTPSRWMMVAWALILQICLGILYAWSVFRTPLMAEYGWTIKQAGYPFMTSLFFFSIGMIFAGRWQDRIGPKKVAMFGGLLLGLGSILAGVIGNTLGGMVFAYGILGGLGVGFAYVTPIATCIKWFPDMRGTITGLAVFGFGAGPLVFGPLVNTLISSYGIPTTFFILGVIFIIFVCGAGSQFKAPPATYVPPGWAPPAAVAGAVEKESWLPSEIIRSGQFWLLWVIYLFGAGAGLMIIGQAVPIGIEGARLSHATAAFGLGAMALFNGLGRLAHGSLSDTLGRTRTVMLLFAEYIVAFTLLLPNADTFTKWLVGICIVGFAYGGYLALMPSITADYFGTKSLGANYGYLFTAWGIAGVGAPFMIDYIKTQTGAFTNAMYIFSVVCAAGIVLTYFSKAPAHKRNL